MSKGFNHIGAGINCLSMRGALGRGLEAGGDRRGVVLRPNDVRERISSAWREREDDHGLRRAVHGRCRPS